jgi:hypothetical protein
MKNLTRGSFCSGRNARPSLKTSTWGGSSSVRVKRNVQLTQRMLRIGREHVEDQQLEAQLEAQQLRVGLQEHRVLLDHLAERVLRAAELAVGEDHRRHREVVDGAELLPLRRKVSRWTNAWS